MNRKSDDSVGFTNFEINAAKFTKTSLTVPSRPCIFQYRLYILGEPNKALGYNHNLGKLEIKHRESTNFALTLGIDPDQTIFQFVPHSTSVPGTVEI